MPELISKPGKRYKYRQLEFWAERGLIHVFDFRGNPYQPDYVKVPVREMLMRARSLNSQLGRMKYIDEREELTRAVENMVAACREAQKQGRPDDPKTFEHIRNMRDKHVLLPGDELAKNLFKDKTDDQSGSV